MKLKITTCYCLCDDFLISEGWRDDQQSTAEVMTSALTAVTFFSGSYERSRVFLEQHGYIPAMLSKSQFSRRLRDIPESVWRGLTKQLAMPFHEKNSLKIYLADSFPVPACRNIRIRRCKIYQDECFRGYIPSRKECFYGLKVHALMTGSGIPAEIFLSPGSYADVNSLYDFSFPVSSGIIIYGDRAYNSYDIEDELERPGIHLNPVRKRNSKRKYEQFSEDGVSFHPKVHRTGIQRHHSKISSSYSCCHLA